VKILLPNLTAQKMMQVTS